jgi:nucleoside-triphosphatase
MSPPKARALLLTGLPGVGKTTVLRRVAERLTGRPIRGFITQEIREGKERVGFGITTFDGRTATLAHVRIRSPHRVGRYGVDLRALDELLGCLEPEEPRAVSLVDEIGKMECLSSGFVAAMKSLLDSAAPVVATVALKGTGFPGEVKRHPGVELWTVTRENRDELPDRVVAWLDR